MDAAPFPEPSVVSRQRECPRRGGWPPWPAQRSRCRVTSPTPADRTTRSCPTDRNTVKPLTDNEIRAALVNCSRREAKQASLPRDLDALSWEELDYLGWVDRSNPQRAYAVVPVDDEPVAFALRASERTRKASAMCAWCEDVFATADVRLWVARRAGAAGREGNSLGTLVHADFSCSQHVRRLPNAMEGGLDPASLVERRIDELRSRSMAFARRVRDRA
ncbi:MAG: FBP domain-containing protein [Dermatophilaceae bacterium]|nr:FBP domain-containing protein [Dermatophilaceae bacterium]